MKSLNRNRETSIQDEPKLAHSTEIARQDDIIRH